MDAYDKAIAWLREQNDLSRAINDNWRVGMYPVLTGYKTTDHPAYFLFGSLGRHRCQFVEDRNQATLMECGCLTLVKDDLERGRTNRIETDKSLIKEIGNDIRVPSMAVDIQDKHLELFAYYQRKADAIFNRPAPVWEGPELVTQGE